MARIRHLAIVSENRERLVKFYTEAFGMKMSMSELRIAPVKKYGRLLPNRPHV